MLHSAMHSWVSDVTTQNPFVPPPPDSSATPVTLATGARFGAYEIRKLIGRGGMATVHEARVLRGSQQMRVALKVPSRGADFARFVAEARMAAAFSHSSFCRVYETGAVDGTPFIAMELLSGATLAEILRDGPIPARLALDVGVALLESLERLHALGYVHRDIKPSNVMLCDGELKLLDFGLARPIGERRSDALTQHGVVVGTPLYMSPEHLVGSTDIDERADVFSTAVVLYELMRGRRPFTGEGDALLQAMTKVRAPSLSSLGRAPEPLARVIERAMAPERGSRHPTATDFARALMDVRSQVEPPIDNMTLADLKPFTPRRFVSM